MKKLLIITAALISVGVLNKSKNESVVIPSSSIRFRVVSNINKLIKQNLMSDNFTVNYGMNYFPSKTYKGIVYDGGYYNSLVVTLGDGEGDNWWCVLFPPLCLMEENETTSDVEYKFFVKSIIEKFR